jgi:hypothetical protein
VAFFAVLAAVFLVVFVPGRALTWIVPSRAHDIRIDAGDGASMATAVLQSRDGAAAPVLGRA